MKVTLPVSQLNELLDIVSKFVSKHSTLQILENIYIKGSIDMLTLRATDMEKFVEIQIPAQIDSEGALTVNARTFTDIIKSIEDKDVQLSLDTSKEVMTIKSAHDSFKIKGISATEYVAVPEVVKVHTVTLDPQLFSLGVSKVEYAVTEKNFSPVLTGILMRIKKQDDGQKVIFVGTDSFRLAEYKVDFKGTTSELSLIIPKTNTTEIKRLADYAVSKKSDSMEITMSENLVSFAFDCNGTKVLATSLLIQGTFPEYDNENIMPSNFSTTVQVDKDGLDKAIRKISILTRDINNYIALDVQPDNLQVTSGDTDRGDAQTSVPASINGEAVVLGLNGRYVSDFIRSTTSNELTLNIVNAEKPLILTDNTDSSYRYVIRPLVK